MHACPYFAVPCTVMMPIPPSSSAWRQRRSAIRGVRLRYLQTLAEIGVEQNSTIVFPMPIDIIKPFLDLMEKAGKRTAPMATPALRYRWTPR